MKVKITLEDANGKKEEFDGIEFSELDKMSAREKKAYIEDFTKKAVSRLVDNMEYIKCYTCNGDGYLVSGHNGDYFDCDECGGSGKISTAKMVWEERLKDTEDEARNIAEKYVNDWLKKNPRPQNPKSRKTWRDKS